MSMVGDLFASQRARSRNVKLSRKDAEEVLWYLQAEAGENFGVCICSDDGSQRCLLHGKSLPEAIRTLQVALRRDIE